MRHVPDKRERETEFSKSLRLVEFANRVCADRLTAAVAILEDLAGTWDATGFDGAVKLANLRQAARNFLATTPAPSGAPEEASR